MDIDEILGVARKRWWVVLAVLLVAVGLGFVGLEREPTQYTANANFALVRAEPPAQDGRDPLEANPLSAGSGLYGGTTLLQDSLISQLGSPATGNEVVDRPDQTNYQIFTPRNDQGQATSQVVSVVVNSTVEADARTTAIDLLTKAREIAEETQRDVGAPPYSRYRVFIIREPELTAQAPSVGKFAAGALIAGLLGGLVASLLYDAVASRRARAKKSSDTIGTTNVDTESKQETDLIRAPWDHASRR